MGGGFRLACLLQKSIALYAMRRLFGLFSKALSLLVETLGERQNASESSSLHGFISMAVYPGMGTRRRWAGSYLLAATVTMAKKKRQL
jgi:hypothetical protein